MNKFESTLETIGKAFLKVTLDVDKAAVVAEPFVDIAFPAIAPIYNAAANGAAAAKAAGQKAIIPGATPEANLAAIALAIEPILASYAAQAGLSAPTIATILAYAAALQASAALA